MCRAILLALCLPLMAAGLSAQLSTVTPKDAIGPGKNTRGVSGLGFGFNLSAHRYQQVCNHDSLSHGLSPFLMKTINFRMPAGRNTGNQGGATVAVAVELSYGRSGLNASTISTQFAQNRDPATTTRVVRKRSIKLPVLGTPTNPSLGFDFKIAFDGGAFLYQPTRQLALVVDIFNYTIVSSSNNYFVDGWTRARSGLPGVETNSMIYASLGSAQDFGTSVVNGSYLGCQSSASKTAKHDSDGETLMIDHHHRFLGSAGVASIPGVMSLGAQGLDVTIPGTSCKVVNDLLLLAPFASDPQGNAELPLILPPDASLIGVTFFTQMFWVDARANAIGVISSNGLKHQIGKGYPAAGSVTKGRALIIEFQ